MTAANNSQALKNSKSKLYNDTENAIKTTLRVILPGCTVTLDRYLFNFISASIYFSEGLLNSLHSPSTFVATSCLLHINLLTATNNMTDLPHHSDLILTSSYSGSVTYVTAARMRRSLLTSGKINLNIHSRSITTDHR